jgi:F0F1-type ATP synthase membrane subunit c/vacuolar-type H+-ATPase subunit K
METEHRSSTSSDLEANMQAPTTSSVDKFARTTRIIAAAIAASVPIYMLIAWLVAPTVDSSGGDPNFIPLLAMLFAVVSVVQLAAAYLVFSARVRAAAEQDTSEERLAGYRVAMIIAFALREAVAIYGLMLSLLSGDARWCIGFGLVALVSMVLGWPRRSEIDRLASEVPSIGV